MPRNYSIPAQDLRLRNSMVWSLHKEGVTGQSIANIFNMERSWINRVVKHMPSGFKSVFAPVVK